jgi:heme exporter protein D
MNWHSLAEFAAMGGYGAYVWGSFGVVFAVMGAEVLALERRWRGLRVRLRCQHNGGHAGQGGR